MNDHSPAERGGGVPRVAQGAISRHRLTRRLEGDEPLWVVRAPAGTGKSTLLGDWAAGRSARDDVVWFGCDPATSSRSGFWVRLLSHLHRRGSISDSGLYSGITALVEQPDSAVPVLQRALGEPDRPVLLIIDDFGALEAGPFWDDIGLDLISLVQRLPGLKCVVSGRYENALERGYVRAKADIGVISESELAFTDAEIREVIASRSCELEEAARNLLVEMDASRHPASLRFMLDMIERHFRGSRSIGGSSSVGGSRSIGVDELRGALRAATLEELLGQLPEAGMREFVGVILHAPFSDVALANELTQRTDADACFRRLEDIGAGRWEHREGVGRVFRLNDIVRSAVETSGTVRQDGIRETEIHGTIARWLYEVHGLALPAIEHAGRAGDLDYLTAVLLRSHPLPRQEWVPASAVISRIPAAQLHERPFLALRHALTLNARAETQPQAIAFIESAARLGRQGTTAPPIERAATLGLESTMYRLLGRARPMRSTAREGLEGLLGILGRGTGDSRYSGVLLAALDQCGMSLFYAGEYALAQDAWVAYAAFADRMGRSAAHNFAWASIALLRVSLGKYREAEDALGRIEPTAYPDALIDSYTQSPEHLARAWLAISDGRPEEALALIRRIEAHLSTSEHWELMVSVRTVAEAMVGRASEAEFRFQQVRSARTTARTLPIVRRRLRTTDALIRLLAHRRQRRIPERSTEVDPAEAAVQAITAMSLGRIEHGLSLIGAAERRESDPLQSAFVAVATAIAAILAPGSTDLVPAAARLSALISDHDLRWPIMLLARSHRERLVGALDERQQYGTAETLRAAFELIPPLIPETLWSAPQQKLLSPRELEVLDALFTTGNRSEIARALFVSVNTVKAQLRSIYAKLGATNREQALSAALQQGLIGPDREAGT